MFEPSRQSKSHRLASGLEFFRHEGLFGGMSKKAVIATLIYSDSESNADQLYLGRFPMADPYVAFVVGRTKFAILNQLEFGRGLKESGYDVILAQEDLAARAKKRYRVERPSVADMIAQVVHERGFGGLRVPAEFPAGTLMALKRRKIAVEVVEDALFPEREIKTDAEAEAIREGNRVSAAGIAAGAEVLRGSVIRNGKLFWRGQPLTSERLRAEIDCACLRAGGIPANTIAAGGDQACDPHCRGSGPLRANELIILDVFPRVQRTGYFGDMTRTFLKGRASDAQRALVDAVSVAQKAALNRVRAGASGRQVHGAVTKVFEQRGFQTVRDSSGARGFIHGTGHGLGLAIHESPRVNPMGPRLRAGMVVTIEPGLYYPGIGGVRIEDVVRVTAKGYELLSSAPYKWEFR